MTKLSRSSSLLFYAEDPGAVNYLWPLFSCSSVYIPSRFVVPSYLSDYCVDRGISADFQLAEDVVSSLLINVSVLVIGTSENPECYGHLLLTEAKQRSIPSIAAVDSVVNYEKRFRGLSDNPLFFIPDWLLVPDIFCERSFVKIGFPKNRIFSIGHPHYDVTRCKFNKYSKRDPSIYRHKFFPKAQSDRDIWLFLGEGVDQLDPQESFKNGAYTLHGFGNSEFRTEICLQELIYVSRFITPQPYIVIRPHPKNNYGHFSNCLALTDQYVEGGDPVELLFGADLIVGMSSMLLLEAYLLRRPHLSILPRYSENNWLVTLKSGLTKTVYTRAELFDTVLNRTYITDHNEDLESFYLPRGSCNKFLEFLHALL